MGETALATGSLRLAVVRRSGRRPDEPGSHGPGESESWSYPTACSTLRLDLWRVGRAVVALGLLVPSGPVSAFAIRRTRLCCGPVRLGLVPCRDCGARLCSFRSLPIATITLVRTPTSNRPPERLWSNF